MRSQRLLFLAAAVFVTACADTPVAPSRVAVSDASLNQSEGRGVFQRYVAIGTSISMGWASDGVYFGSQTDSWPAQLARMGNREITQPYIAFPGCRSPLLAPLGSLVRLSGESSTANAATLSCAPLLADVTLPAQNVAINAARTFDALFTTPENVTDAANRLLYSRVLPPGATQVSAMEAQKPKLVSVELGGMEVLDARSGIAIVGVTITPPAAWAVLYRQVLDRVEASTAKHVLLVGLLTTPSAIPAFAFGSEIAANAPVLFAGFHVAVQPDCATTNSQNLIFTIARLPAVIQQGLAAKAASQPPVPFTCEEGSPTTPDFILTPEEQAIAAGVLAQMDAVIRAEATARGWAYFSLDALYGAPGVRVPLNVATLLTSATPFGPFMSLDGVHPSAAGQSLLADAAARALNETYDLGVQVDTP